MSGVNAGLAAVLTSVAVIAGTIARGAIVEGTAPPNTGLGPELVACPQCSCVSIPSETYWEAARMSYDTEKVSLTPDGPPAALYWKDIDTVGALVEGAEYLLTFDLMIQSGYIVENNDLVVVANFADAAVYDTLYNLPYDTNAGGWQAFSYLVTVPAGATRGQIGPKVYPVSAFHVDNMSFRQIVPIRLAEGGLGAGMARGPQLAPYPAFSPPFALSDLVPGFGEVTWDGEKLALTPAGPPAYAYWKVLDTPGALTPGIEYLMTFDLMIQSGYDLVDPADLRMWAYYPGPVIIDQLNVPYDTGAGGWQSFSYRVWPPVGGTQSQMGVKVYPDAAFFVDNLSFTTVVPGPATGWLVLGGLLAWAGFRRRIRIV